ncbi:RNA ligase/cyclic nucleotide phosphodiesterase [Aspergillus stella-maris]|uniref:RNA ligase/cyclic nucleotide phosphodiesterase n=1 Tax=Aspergillus stella-maris TaxID=1810926 RepID=UPI003CCD4797
MTELSMPDKSVKKFYPDGTSKVYRGHSVISPLPRDSPLRTTLNEVYDALSNHDLREDLFPEEALLPPDSWHMTVFIGIRDLERGANVMPGDGHADYIKKEWGLNGSYEQWLDYTKAQLESQGGLSFKAAPPYELKVEKDIDQIVYHIAIPLDPTPETWAKLTNARNQLSDQTGIRFPNHDTPRFHITMAYLVRGPEYDEATELKELVDDILVEAPDTVEFPSVGLHSFEDMQSFKLEVDLS